MTALRVADLAVRTRHQTLVEGVSLTVGVGERVGLIGESGSGKSLTALSVLGLLPDNLTATGTVDVAGERDLLARPERRLARLRGSLVSMIFQEPMTALDPLVRVGAQVAEVVTLHDDGVGRARSAAARRRAVALLTEVGLPDPAAAARAYPHQLSGGQRQRVMIAMALANDPALLVADEPTTALDVTVQAQVLDLMGELVARRGTGLLFITHDLAVVSRVCERVLVMKDGTIVEQGTVEDVFRSPRHEYTRRLLDASDLTPRRRAAHATNAEPEPEAAPAPAPGPPPPSASRPSHGATAAAGAAPSTPCATCPWRSPTASASASSASRAPARRRSCGCSPGSTRRRRAPSRSPASPSPGPVPAAGASPGRAPSRAYAASCSSCSRTRRDRSTRA
ncbi:ABC transporter ATP-binding protein [Xylanimonas allomyrinae]|uniref:ABC transporter ATP-binding protein n=1 Tax=Xylanimonas allomyrinae TaxID=2509459 RepID=A0A4P6EM91_9MICO|nr:ABC transporter ATP-binding protein [Xylanimonas allomyrinae]